MASNTFEGGTDGVALSTGNSGGASGTAFDTVTIGTNTTLEYDTAQAVHGAVSMKVASGATATTVFAQWTGAVGTQTTIYGRAYLYLTAAIANNARFFVARGGTGQRAALMLTSAQKIRSLNAANGTVQTTTASHPVNQWFRVEWKMIFSATVGQIVVKNFWTADSVTADETLTSAATQNTGVDPDNYIFGMWNNLANIGPFWQDDINVNIADYPGPAVRPRVQSKRR